MQVLTTHGWAHGYLDEPLAPGCVRIEVSRYLRLAQVDGLYFERPAHAKLLLNYVREYGVADVLRKVASRRSESTRNSRWLAVGLGHTLTEGNLSYPVGTAVVFIVTAGPLCAERVVVPTHLLARADPTALRDGEAAVRHGASCAQPPPALTSFAGWSSDSGVPPPPANQALAAAGSLLREFRGWERQPIAASDVRTFRPSASARDGRTSAVLHGYGGYAKTILIPGIGRHLQIVRVVDLDPYQLGNAHRPWAVSTQPWDSTEEEADVVILAGYHHTHAAEAASAMTRGQVAVIEKPPATTSIDVHLLATSLRNGGRASVSYQRRHSSLLELIGKALPTGVPLSYRAVVFEEPLPPRHWYRWPASRTRLVSNGVHWIDEFLSLTGYQCPTRAHHFTASDGEETTTTLELPDGSVMSLALGSRGANRVGLRDFVEIRAGDVTARLIDGSYLELEQGYTRLRRRTRRLRSYRRMYEQIAEAASQGRGLDTPESATLAAAVAIHLEEHEVIHGDWRSL